MDWLERAPEVVIGREYPSEMGRQNVLVEPARVLLSPNSMVTRGHQSVWGKGAIWLLKQAVKCGSGRLALHPAAAQILGIHAHLLA